MHLRHNIPNVQGCLAFECCSSNAYQLCQCPPQQAVAAEELSTRCNIVLMCRSQGLCTLVHVKPHTNEIAFEICLLNALWKAPLIAEITQLYNGVGIAALTRACLSMTM